MEYTIDVTRAISFKNGTKEIKNPVFGEVYFALMDIDDEVKASFMGVLFTRDEIKLPQFYIYAKEYGPDFEAFAKVLPNMKALSSLQWHLFILSMDSTDSESLHFMADKIMTATERSFYIPLGCIGIYTSIEEEQEVFKSLGYVQSNKNYFLKYKGMKPIKKS